VWIALPVHQKTKARELGGEMINTDVRCARRRKKKGASLPGDGRTGRKWTLDGTAVEERGGR